jgi:hypothetical protein
LADINMKVLPSFYTEECAIVFSFYFDNTVKKIGEAVIYTCEEQVNQPLKKDSIRIENEKVAYVKEFSIVEEYEHESFEQITHFLGMCGIKKCFLERAERQLLAH